MVRQHGSCVDRSAFLSVGAQRVLRSWLTSASHGPRQMRLDDRCRGSRLDSYHGCSCKSSAQSCSQCAEWRAASATCHEVRVMCSLELVSCRLTSLFSTNKAISETKGQGWKVTRTQWRKANDILTSTLDAFLFSSHPKKGKGSRGSFKLLRYHLQRWRPLFNAAKLGWRPLLDAVQ